MKSNFSVLSLSKFLIILASLIGLTGCHDKDKDRVYSSEDSVYVFIDEVMNSWYYWYQQVPEVDILAYEEPADLLDALIYKPLDRWSFIDDTTTINSLFDEGIYYGFGFMVRFDNESNLRIIFVYESSDAYAQGIRKGDIIQTINGVSPVNSGELDLLLDENPATFTFGILNKEEVSYLVTLSKSEVLQNAVFSCKLFTHILGKTIGYLAYEDFLGYGKPELDSAFTYFKENPIDELIVDLRYNTGGYISLAKQMAEMIAPVSTVNHPFVTYSHNDIIAPNRDTTYYFAENELNLDLGRVFFITTQFTASASELVINSLEPYMNVYLVGSKTHGKPVGMYGFQFHEWYLFPITVSLRNANGYGDFFDGLPVDFPSGEGLEMDWGDVTDPNIQQALYYIENGASLKASDSKLTESSYNLQSELSSKRSYLLLDR